MQRLIIIFYIKCFSYKPVSVALEATVQMHHIKTIMGWLGENFYFVFVDFKYLYKFSLDIGNIFSFQEEFCDKRRKSYVFLENLFEELIM